MIGAGGTLGAFDTAVAALKPQVAMTKSADPAHVARSHKSFEFMAL